VKPTDPYAVARFVPRAPRKVRLMADLVRGRSVADALAQLQFSPRHAARDLAKVIRSAAANAEHNQDMDREQLWIKEVRVDGGPIRKRIRPVSRGAAHHYFRRLCHITVVVEERESDRAARRRAPRPVPQPQAEPQPEAEPEPVSVAEANDVEGEG
jgi:large subunit ribosomal protein L22